MFFLDHCIGIYGVHHRIRLFRRLLRAICDNQGILAIECSDPANTYGGGRFILQRKFRLLASL